MFVMVRNPRTQAMFVMVRGMCAPTKMCVLTKVSKMRVVAAGGNRGPDGCV